MFWATSWVIRGQDKPLIRDFLGLNGHTVQFKPDFYRPVCSLARDYHPVEWDLASDTATLPQWPLAKNRVDWSQVYGSWTKKGWRISASLMFESVPRSRWKNLEADAQAYGKSFARAFGPSGKHPCLEAVEIGNEPGDWNDADYTAVLGAMAKGIREGDPRLKIAPCNLTAGKSGRYEKSVECIKDLLPMVDVLNIHSYPQLEGWPTWRRSFPEDPALPEFLSSIQALCRWRDEHAPGKPVWLTEFGYDSSTKSPPAAGDFAKWVGVTDLQQAQWLVRSCLLLSSLPVARAYVYFFDDKDEPQVHGSAGLTRNFQPKPSFYALSHLQRVMGDYRFQRTVIDQPGRLRVQEYVHGQDTSQVVWAAWTPTGPGKSIQHTFEELPGTLQRVERMALAPTDPAALAPDQTKPSVAGVTLEIGEAPVYLEFHRP